MTTGPGERPRRRFASAERAKMLRIYQSFRETGRFETLQRCGAARARAVGVTTEQDVQRLIEEARRT